MDYAQLKLENQIWFPLYAASRLVTREYQPHLDKLGITYPQYLVLMVLWENNGLTVNDISEKLILNTNTLTPLLKRMEKQQLLSRRRDVADERKVLISLTEKGMQLREEAASIPGKLFSEVVSDQLTQDRLLQLRDTLYALICQFHEKG